MREHGDDFSDSLELELAHGRFASFADYLRSVEIEVHGFAPTVRDPRDGRAPIPAHAPRCSRVRLPRPHRLADASRRVSLS